MTDSAGKCTNKKENANYWQPLKVITKVTITKKELSHEKATFEICYEESTYNEKCLK